MSDDAVRIAGSPTPLEVAAVLAALRTAGGTSARLDRYEQWRRIRIAAMRRSSPR